MNHFPQLWSQSWDGLATSQGREVTPEAPEGLEDGFGQDMSHPQPPCPAVSPGVTAPQARVPEQLQAQPWAGGILSHRFGDILSK